GLVAIAIVAGGDTHPFGRFMLPVIPLLALDLGWLLQDGARRIRTMALIVTTLYVALQAMLVITVATVTPDFGQRVAALTTGAWPYRKMTHLPHMPEAAAAMESLDRHLAPDLAVLGTDVGLLAYATNRRIRDSQALNEPELAHLPKPAGFTNKWGIRRLPELIAQEVPVVYAYFPLADPWSWQQIETGALTCSNTVVSRLRTVTLITENLTADYHCASVPVAGHPNRWTNFFVRRDLGAAAFRDLTGVARSACLPAVRAACEMAPEAQ
ncbi:MAG: hypothetical protein AAF245_06920, partial [Pseudomonadota bacterium]